MTNAAHAEVALHFGEYANYIEVRDPYKPQNCPRPIRLNMVADFSGSMGDNANQNSIAAFKATANRLPLQAQVNEHNAMYPVQMAAGVFTSGYHIIQNMTSSHPMMTSAIAQFQRIKLKDQSTNMQAGLSWGVKELNAGSSSMAPLHILVLILDGAYSGSPAPVQYDLDMDPKSPEYNIEMMLEQFDYKKPEVYKDKHELEKDQKQLLAQIESSTNGIDYIFILGQGEHVDAYFLGELESRFEKVIYMNNDYAAMMDFILQELYDSGCA
ncbi:MAG: hypothetical protein R3A45_01845 [Bdellovibrionota bacterium]